MMRTFGDYVLTTLSMALVIGIARFLFELAAIIQFHHPVEASQLVTLGWTLIAITAIISVGANWMRARERERAKGQMLDLIEHISQTGASPERTRVAGD